MNTLPVGFLGHGQQFHRRRGPEGEEQDIVGPNGHLEQLPPYTRYADTFNAKSTAAGLLSANTDAEPGSRSDEPLMEMHERNGAELFAHEANASDPAREAARVESPEVTTHEKPAKRSIWIERGKVKLCGFLPLWVLLLAILFVVLVAAICGSVVGTFLRGRPKRLGDPLTDGYRYVPLYPRYESDLLTLAPEEDHRNPLPALLMRVPLLRPARWLHCLAGHSKSLSIMLTVTATPVSSSTTSNQLGHATFLTHKRL